MTRGLRCTLLTGVGALVDLLMWSLFRTMLTQWLTTIPWFAGLYRGG